MYCDLWNRLFIIVKRLNSSGGQASLGKGAGHGNGEAIWDARWAYLAHISMPGGHLKLFSRTHIPLFPREASTQKIPPKVWCWLWKSFTACSLPGWGTEGGQGRPLPPRRARLVISVQVSVHQRSSLSLPFIRPGRFYTDITYICQLEVLSWQKRVGQINGTNELAS